MTSLVWHEEFHPKKPLALRQQLRLAAEVLAAYARLRPSLAREGLPAALSAARTASVSASEGYVDEMAERRYVGYRLGNVVQRVLKFVPDARCLMRSLVLVRILARRGIPSTLVIGVAPAPHFRAHAWVEVDGLAVLPAYESDYSRLSEL